ncbi:MAG: choice-of-anchor D domain-containing protein [Candidatus Sulfotelmatobacter sp.]
MLLGSAVAHGAAPAVTLAPTSLTFGTQLRGTTSSPQIVTVTNTGTSFLTLSSIRPSSGFSQTHTCQATLAAGASCTISVSFTPVANGTVSGTLTISDNAQGSPQSVALSGTGAIVSLTPGSLNFGNDAVGAATASQIVTLANVGQNTVKVSAVTFQGANATDFSQTNACGSVSVGASCNINVVFTPSAAGSRNATLSVTLASAVSPVPVTLTGTGVSGTSPVPLLNQPLAPTTAAPGSPATTLTINGAGFASGDSVLWNGSSRTTTFISAGTIQASLLASDLATAGTAQVTVKNTSGAGGVSNSQPFQIASSASTLAMAGPALSVGEDPRGMVVADFNGDGRPDLAVVNRGSNTVSILLGNGDGTFAAQSSFATGTDPIAIAVGDFNGDGKLDLVTANRASYNISVLLGNGDGTFQSHVDYVAGTEPIGIVVADFNRDGYLDVAEINSADNTISVLLGVGNGTFQPQVTYPSGSSPNAIAVGDFNGDGIADLAAADSATSNVAVLFGNGDGTFGNASFYPTGSDPDGLLAADLNGDGKLDLVAANNGSNTISVLLNNGGGIFASGVTYPVGNLPFAISAFDAYDTGKLSIAVVNYGDNTVSILPGNGDGTFNEATVQTFPTGDDPIGMAVGDFNLDGRPDLVVSNSEDNTVSILLQSPATALSSTALAFGSQTIGTTSAPQNILLTNSGSANLLISSIALTGTNTNQYGETNNCPGTLVGGGSCTISVTFSPTINSTVTANVSITDNAMGSPQTVSLLGTGASSAVTLSPSSLTFSSQAVGTTSSSQNVSLTNTGSVTLGITSISATGNFGQTNNCGTSLVSGATCTIGVTFTPLTTGTLTGTVSISDSIAGSPQTVSLTGTGSAAATVTFSPATLTFASQSVDTTSVKQTVTLTNTGSGLLTISSVSTTGSYSETNTCGASVAAGASCTINVTFDPTVVGTNSGSVVITDNAANSPQSVGLSGTGASTSITFAPTSLSFGTEALNVKSAAKTLQLSNTTGARLTFSKLTISPNYSQTNNCSGGVASGASCTINVSFTPTASGTIAGTITLTDSGSGAVQTVPLTGTGASATVVLSPASVTFANQSVGSSSAASTVTLTNTGTAALTITSVSITGTNPGDYSQTNNCGSSIAAGGSCSINAVFTPTASGTRSASISVSDSATGSPQTVAVTGTGVAPAATLTPVSLAFSSLTVGSSSSPQNVTLSNTGNSTLTLSSITITGLNPSDFSQTNNCGSSLAAATNCTISVTFTPLASGSRQANLSVADNVSGSPQIVALNGTGNSSGISFSTSSVTFPAQGVGTSSPVSGITLFNIGNSTLSITSIAVTGTNPGDFSQTNNCGSSVASGSNCTINVTFTPTVVGTRAATISVSDNATGSPQSVALSGTGTSGGPSASLSATSLTFAAQNLLTTSSSQKVTLTNTGAVTLNLLSIVASGDYAETNTCGSSLAAGVNCTVQVTFTPSAAGTRTGYVTFTDNDPSTQQTVNLTGTGTAPSSTVSIVPVQVSVTPEQSSQLQAYISGVASSKVTWAVDGIVGGSSSVGTISTNGFYTAPTAPGSHVITATSTANTTQVASVPVVVTSYSGTFVYHNDDGRTGQNLQETVLTTGNVNTTQFGKIFSYPVDGQIYAEPLYVQGVSIPGQGMHNVTYVATENDSVYAFDADGATTTPLWQVSFLTNGAQTLSTTDIGGCSNISPQVGITSTPVIDPQTNVIFVLARTKVVSGTTTSYYQTLHALDITTGLETPGSPVVIQASYPSSSGTVTFNPQTQNQRSGLFLDNGVVFISWASHCDIQPYHGWIMGYQEGSLQQVAVFNTTPNGVEGGIWQSGAAPAVDENGNIYAMLGNGTTDINTGGVDYGEALVNFSFTGSALTISDYFLPSNFQSLNNSDLDLGSGAPMLLPTQTTAPTELLVAAGKQGVVYLVDRTNLGKYNASGNQVLQTLPAGTVPTAHSMPAYWQNNIYFCGVSDYLKSYLLSDGLLSTSPTSESPSLFGYPGATPAVSANGSTNGIVWAISTAKGGYVWLHAYDAVNLSRELYNTGQNSARDQGGIAVKFVVPTVANGKVYLATQGELDVYGLLPQP